MAKRLGRMRYLVAALLVAVALAGCSDDGGSEANDGHAHHGDSEYGGDTSLVTDMPEWEIGQYWSYVDQDGTEFDLVVAADEGGSWLLLNSDLGNAMFDWRFDVSFLGSIQKSDLSGKQGTDTIQFFDWPLEHNKDWTTKWDGESRHARAHASDGGKWHIAVHAGGSDADQNFAEMMYDPATGWFESMIFYGDDGEEQYVLTSTGAGTGYVGNVYRYTAVNDEAITINTTGPSNPSGTLNIGDDVTELIAWTTLDCGGQPGAMGIGMQEPMEDGSPQVLPPLLTFVDQGVDTMGYFDQCPGASGSYEEMRVDPRPGTWKIDGLVAGPEQRIDFQVGVRTYETFTF